MARLRPWLQAGVFLLAIGFLAALIGSQWRQLQGYPWQIQIGWLLLALALLWLTWLLELNQWRFILGRLGGALSYGEAARIWFLSNIIRYIPGNVWQFLGMSEMAAQHGIPRTATFTSIALHQAVSTLAGLLLAAIYFALAGHGAWFDRLRPALWLAPLGLIFLHPRVLEATLNRALTWLKRPALRITLTVADLARLLLAYSLVWLGFGLGFSALVRGLTPITPAQAPWMMAGYAAAYVLGYLSLLTPSGLGVREGVLVLLLQSLFSAPLPAIIAIVARLWMVIGEIGGALTVLIGRWALRRDWPSLHSAHTAQPQPARWKVGLKRLTADRVRLAVLALFLLYVVGFSLLSIRPHDALRTHMADLGQMDLAIWNTSQGRFVQEIKDDFVSTRLTDHVEPIFLPIALVFFLWNDVRALLILQTLALASGALVVFALARATLRPATSRLTAWLPCGLALAYLVFPAVQAANLAEFHAIPFAATPILLAFWCQERRRWWGFVLACLLLLSVKEEAALLAFMLGLFVLSKAWLARRDRAVQAPNVPGRDQTPGRRAHLLRLSPTTAGLLVMLLSLGWFYLATFVIIPHYASQVYGVQQSVYFARYGALGDSPAAIIKNFFTQPTLVWKIATETPRLAYLAGLLAPFGFLSLLAPEILLLSAPLLIANLFSAYPAQFSGEFHYSAPLVPYVAFAALIGVRRLLQVRPSALRLVLAWLLLWAGGCQIAAGYTPLGREFRWPEITPHARLLARFAAQVPASAPGSVTTALYPHFSHRQQLFKFPIVGAATWVLVDVTGATDRHPVEIQTAVLNLLEQGWHVLDAADGYVLLQKAPVSGLNPACQRSAGEAAFAQCALPDAFFDFARADRSGLLSTPPVLSSQPLLFGERLALRGHDLVDDGKWKLTSWRSYWQAQAPLPLDLRVWPFAVSSDGSLADDPALRPAVEALWYPPSRWQPGELILIETLPWYLPAAWAPAVGVFQGDSWADVGRRWRVQGAAARFDQETWAQLTAVRREGRRLIPLVEDAAPTPIASWNTAAGTPWGDLRRVRGLPTTLDSAGVTLPLTLTWQLAAPAAPGLSVFVHLRDGAGHNVAQADGQPVWFGPQPFNVWAVGQPGSDRRNLEIPATVAPGAYTLVLGLYDADSGQRLPLTTGGDETAVGTVTVRQTK
jgi:uncharacterized membrane protein